MDSNITRLLRADRAGILVSEVFHLIEFLHHFDSMTPGQQGIDVTVDQGFGAIQAPNTSHSPKHIQVELEGNLPHIKSLVGRARRVARVYSQTLK